MFGGAYVFIMSKAWTKDIYIDPGTFGGSRACHVLADMLNNNVIPIYEKHRVLAFLNKSNIVFKNLTTIPDRQIRIQSFEMWKRTLLNQVAQFNYPIKIKSYISNVLFHSYRKNLGE